MNSYTAAPGKSYASITKTAGVTVSCVDSAIQTDPVPGRPTIWMIVGQGPIALAIGAGGGLFGYFYSRLSFFSFSLSLGDGPI